MLANSPLLFHQAQDILFCDFDSGRPPYAMTNRGLSLELLFEEDTGHEGHEGIDGIVYLKAPLNCIHRKTGHGIDLLLEVDLIAAAYSGK
jgi:hypothetical protein